MDFTENFKNRLICSIVSKYKTQTKRWKPQPGIEMGYKTLKGYKLNEIKKEIQNERFTIEKVVIRLDNAPVKFVLDAGLKEVD